MFNSNTIFLCSVGGLAAALDDNMVETPDLETNDNTVDSAMDDQDIENVEDVEDEADEADPEAKPWGFGGQLSTLSH